MELGNETVTLLSAFASAAFYLVLVMIIVTSLANFAVPFIKGIRWPW